MRYTRRSNNSLVSVAQLTIFSVIVAALTIYPLFTQGAPIWNPILKIILLCIATSAITFRCRNLSIIRKNLLFPTFFFFLIGGSIGFETGWWKGYLISALIYIAWLITISLPKDEKSAWKIFTIMFCIGVASIFDRSVVVLIPTFILALQIYNKLTIESIVASIFGFSTTYALTSGVYFILDDFCSYKAILESTSIRYELLRLRISDIIIYSAISFYIIVAFISFSSRYHSNSIYLRSTLLITYILLFSGILEMVFLGACSSVYLLLVMLSSILLSGDAESTSSKARKILFYTIISVVIFTTAAQNFILLN